MTRFGSSRIRPTVGRRRPPMRGKSSRTVSASTNTGRWVSGFSNIGVELSAGTISERESVITWHRSMRSRCLTPNSSRSTFKANKGRIAYCPTQMPQAFDPCRRLEVRREIPNFRHTMMKHYFRMAECVLGIRPHNSTLHNPSLCKQSRPSRLTSTH